MIFDQENMFLDKSLATNVIANVGGGDAHDPLFLVVFANTALTASGEVTAQLQTCDVEAFDEDVETVATYSLAKSKKGLLVAAKIPYGMKKFVRLNIAGSPTGALTAGLTETVPNWP